MSRQAKQPPHLTIVVEIEGGGPRVSISAASAEDELALIRWLRRKPRILARLADIEALLDQLDRRAA
jgi:hypothetical protein